MRKPVRIVLTAGVAAALLSCGRRAADPCDSAYFDDQACRDAVANHGYYWHGGWHSMGYSHPYPFYYDTYNSYRLHGGRVSPAPMGSYAHGMSSPGSSHGTTVRGGFGDAAAAHGSGGAGA